MKDGTMEIGQSTIYSRNGKVVQIVLESPGCFYSKVGYCHMCDYGSGRMITPEEAVGIVQRAIYLYPRAQRMILGSLGSLLDIREVSREVLLAVLKCIKGSRVHHLYIETHCDTVTAEVLYLLRQQLPGIDITIEMGLETSNPDILSGVVNKKLDLAQLIDKIHLVHQLGMLVALNVLYGLWYEESRMSRDFSRTCQWAAEHGAEEIVVFPLNFKPRTVPWHLYQSGLINPPSHADMIQQINELEDWILERIYFSWYGERQFRGGLSGCIPPDFGVLDPFEAMQFYHDFMDTVDVETRRRLIRQILRSKEVEVAS